MAAHGLQKAPSVHAFLGFLFVVDWVQDFYYTTVVIL